MRIDSRLSNQLRKINIQCDFIEYPEGSVLFSQGNTKVLCNVTIEDNIPRWMQVQNVAGGWITGEYSLLPRSTHTRTARETNGVSGRTHEIRRLIGRSLRSVVNLSLLGPRTIIIDCDVLQADGGTRTASITGGYIALMIALNRLIAANKIPSTVFQDQVAAVSVGIVDGIPLLDLCYSEDSQAEVDFNIVMNARGEYIEMQGTAEKLSFSRSKLNELLDLAGQGIQTLFEFQRMALK